MIVFGIDCSVKQSSICIMRDDICIYNVVQNTNITHSQNLMNMISASLECCNLTSNDIDLYAVTVGPGSFTGLRIGMAIIKGMASVNNTPCIGMSSLLALKKCVDSENVIIPCFDARRNQVYTMIEDDVVLLEECCINAYNIENYVKNINKNVIFVGDGKNLCYNIYGEYPNVKTNNITMPCIAYGACILAIDEYNTNGGKTHFDLHPSYLRLAQAEQELKEKMEK